MQALPHHYRVCAQGQPEGDVTLSAARLPALATAAPPEFGGPEGYWSPESLLVGAVANCFVLSFRAVARASQLKWRQLEVDVEGALDRLEGVTQFTGFTIRVRLTVEEGATESLAQAALAKAKRACLITNSLKAHCELVQEIVT